MSPALSNAFAAQFGIAPSVLARAPGRVEFIGNHTDYNGGAVLGAAIDRYVTVAAVQNPHHRIRLASTAQNRRFEVDAGAVQPGLALAPGDRWALYPLGAWQALRDSGRARPEGFDLLVDSTLPAGAGLSSSAALELATVLALVALTGDSSPPPAELAAIGRRAENAYVGVPCGILDQGTSAHGEAGALVHIDCRGPVFSRVPFPRDARLWIFDSREKHTLVDGLYATRFRECTDAARQLGVAWLADLTPEAFAARADRLDPILARRARHVITEHARVATTVAALRNGDLAAVGRLLLASHRSSRLDFENSTPALDALVDTLAGRPEVFGARLTGGGFGGAVMALTSDAFTADAATDVAHAVTQAGHPAPGILPLSPGDGARLLAG